jgi:hypothetical protein
MSKIKIGDIFDIKTPKGNAYLHYIFKDKTIGELVRVLPGLYNLQPDNLDGLVGSKESFMIFFPLTQALKQKIVALVGHYPENTFHKPKHMRTEHIIRGEFLGWHIIDTDTWARKLVKDLTPEQKKMSPWGVWNDTLLIERLVEGWDLEKWI